MSENLSPIGFWSYARQDDEEKLSGLRSILQRQLQQKYGREPIKIFQDVAAIPPGADWNHKITEALNSSTFLIPIITPNFLESRWCNEELFLFLKREQAIATQFPELAGVKRIFPIDYIDISDVDAYNPQLLPELRTRQWTKFHDLRYKDPRDEAVLLRLDQIAESICKEVLRLDQRVAREVRNAAAAQKAREDAAAQEAAASQKAASEQQAREAETLRRQQEHAAQAALAAEQAQRAAKERESAEIAERRKREEEQRTAAAQRHAQEETGLKTQAEDELRKNSQSETTPVDAKTETAATIPVRHWWAFSRKQKVIAAVVAGFLGVFFAFTHWGLPVIIYSGVLQSDVNLVHVTVKMHHVLGLSLWRDSGALWSDSQECAEGDGSKCFDLAMNYDDGHYASQDPDKAAAMYARADTLDKAACGRGDGNACYQLGSRDHTNAAQFYTRACDLGDRNGCDSLGLAYWSGDGVNRDPGKAVDLVSKSCDLGFDCWNLAMFAAAYQDGNGVPKSTAKAEALYKKACDAYVANSCFSLAYMQMDDGNTQHEASAAAFFTQDCNAGNSVACYNLGIMYDNGKGVAKDNTQAVALYQKACDAGNAIGCTNLGFMYESGKGVTKDNTQAVALYRKACDAGNAIGCTNLGFMYESGKGVTRDNTQAVALYRKACDAGNARGCSNLGTMYEDGTGVTRDNTQAVALYRKACDAGNADGCANLKRIQP